MIREEAALGFTGGERYERSRPGYPPEAVAALVEALRIGPGVPVLDLAAGTGKLTRHLVATGAEVVAVEPVEGMRRELAAAMPDVLLYDGTAEAIPLPDGAVDVVTVAQAFHWFDGPGAVGELHRVLAPGGRLGLLWNVMDRDVEWVDRLQEVVHRHRGTSPWYDGHLWRAAFRETRLFGPLRHRSFVNVQVVDQAGLAERVSSISFIATLEEAERARVLDEVRTMAAGLPRIELPYRTDVFYSERLA